MENQPFTQTPPPSQPGMVQIAVPQVKPYATYALIVLTVGVYLLQLGGQYLLGADIVTYLGFKVNELIRAGEVWRLITPMFLHGSMVHIGFNMYALFLFGRGLESRYGHARFLLLYFLAGFAGNVLSFVLTAANSLGASTAIFGLLAAEGVFLLQNRKILGSRANRSLMNLLYMAAINLFLGFTVSGVDNFGHIGGMLGGVLFAWFGGPRWNVEAGFGTYRLVDEREGHGALTGTLVVLIIFVPLAILGWMFPR
jgi:rhomboid protease GluP